MTKVKWNGLTAEISQNRDFCTIDYGIPTRSLSSAVLSGGFSEIRRVLNYKVKANPEINGTDDAANWDPPEKTLSDFASKMNWDGPLAGMMTSALMDSYRIDIKEEKWGGVFAALTAGISNARAAGDKADFLPEVRGEMLPTGTINIMIGTNVRLTEAALTEAVMVATEAKAAVLSKYKVKSTLSGLPATGTGTDSIIISSGNGPHASFCGKHTRIGQLIGETVTTALSSSLEYLLARDK